MKDKMRKALAVVFLRTKLIMFLMIFIFIFIYLLKGQILFLGVTFGIILNWLWIIFSVYLKKNYYTLNSLGIPLSYRKGKNSEIVVQIIGDCIINKAKSKELFVLGIYKVNSLLFLIKSKQYYSQIDCNAEYGDFGLVIELNGNENKEDFLKWLKINLPTFKYFIDVNKDLIIINIFSEFVMRKFNSPLIAEILYGYIELDDQITLRSNYIIKN